MLKLLLNRECETIRFINDRFKFILNINIEMDIKMLINTH